MGEWQGEGTALGTVLGTFLPSLYPWACWQHPCASGGSSSRLNF